MKNAFRDMSNNGVKLSHNALVAIKKGLDRGIYPTMHNPNNPSNVNICLGLCNAVYRHISAAYPDSDYEFRSVFGVYVHFEQWPEYSGNSRFPVTAEITKANITQYFGADAHESFRPNWLPDGTMPVKEAAALLFYNITDRPENPVGFAWSADNEYGAARLRLLDWLIEQAEEQLKENAE